MKRKPQKLIWLIVIILIAAVAIIAWFLRASILNTVRENSVKEEVPSPQAAAQFELSGTKTTTAPKASPLSAPPPPLPNPPVIITGDVNLDVPFAPQAPLANWDQPYQDACEEAAVIMVEHYLSGRSLTLNEMDSEILSAVEFQTKKYGFYIDSNSAETARFAMDFNLHLNAEVVYDITANDIKAKLNEGIPVIALANGQRLNNPFFTAPGPEHHAIVIKGVKGDKFITNDPGTKRGADYLYPIDTVMNALEDYDGDTPGTYKPTAIFLTPSRP